MESGKKSFDSFRNLVIILAVLCYTVIHSMSLRWYFVFGQLNYTKTRVFHAILLPVIIEFSRCIGTYSSAKFELLILSVLVYIAGNKIQCIMGLAAIPILLYNGKRGHGMKNFFYIFYPAHIGILYIISALIIP